jgi:phospholipid/cholesterol/gamma-HCH transport system permease protein
MNKQKTSQQNNSSEQLKFERAGDSLIIKIKGQFFQFAGEQPAYDDILNAIKKVQFVDDGIESWDSSLLLPIYELIKEANEKGINSDISALPQNLQEMIKLAFAVDRKPSHGGDGSSGFLEKLGENTIKNLQKTGSVFIFLGNVCSAVGRVFTGKSIMRGTDFGDALNECGPKALGIITIVSFLVGLILAFVGALQLKTFGAQIYVASLVTIGMCRIMGAIMVGIIMAGRTGSAYAATIGTMQVNEELDALQTMGLSATDFLVLPRILALVLAMPILTMLADFMGMLGGAAVGVFMLDIPYQEYWNFSFKAFNLTNFLVGVFHGFCFGIIIAVCGCYQGVNCGRNADSVGIATTKSVVSAIVAMIVATGIITVIFQEIGI